MAAPADVDLHVVVPVYNEAENFRPWYQSLKSNVRTPHRVVVVYDRDEDTTVPVVKELQQQDPDLLLVKNTGKGVLGALVTGLRYPPRGAIVVSMADLSDDHRRVDPMYQLYKEGCAVVSATRYGRGGEQRGGPLVKRTLSRIAGLSLHFVGGLPTTDPTNNFKLYSKELVDQVQVESTGGFEVALELTVKAHALGMRIGEVPTIWTDRVAGKSNFKLMKWLPSYLRWYRFAMEHRAGALLGSR